MRHLLHQYRSFRANHCLSQCYSRPRRDCVPPLTSLSGSLVFHNQEAHNPGLVPGFQFGGSRQMSLSQSCVKYVDTDDAAVNIIGGYDTKSVALWSGVGRCRLYLPALPLALHKPASIKTVRTVDEGWHAQLIAERAPACANSPHPAPKRRCSRFRRRAISSLPMPRSRIISRRRLADSPE